MFSRAFAPAVCLLVVSSVLFVSMPARAAAGSLGAIQVWGQDNDADGLIDVVMLNVTVDVTAAGNFSVMAYWDASQPEPDTAELGVGSHVLHPSILGFYFFNLGKESPYVAGPYTLTVTLWDMATFTTIDTKDATTPAWTPDDFDPPGARITALGITDFIDRDGSGRYDTLAVNFTLAVRTAGTYGFFSRVTSESGLGAITTLDTLRVPVGTANHTIMLDVSMIEVLGWNGPINAEFSIVETFGSDGHPVSTWHLYMLSYTADQFDPPWAWIAPGITDQGVNLDAAGGYDLVLLHVPVHMGHGGTITLSADLHCSGYNVTGSSPATALPPGDWIVDVPIPAYYIPEAGLPGPYPVDVHLQVAEIPGYVNSTSYLTAAYAVEDFYDQSDYLDPHAPGYGVEDTDGDGKAEFFDINSTVQVLAEGDYFLEGGIRGPNGMGVASGQYFHLTKGFWNLTSRFSGISVNRHPPNSIASGMLRLDAPTREATGWGMGSGSPFVDPSLFESRDTAFLNGTVTSSSGAPASAIVWALNTTDGFRISDSTDGYGRYSLAAYNGTFTVFVQSMLYPDRPTALNVTIDGATVQDIVLPKMAPRGTTYDATLDVWNATIVTARLDYGGMSLATRVYADLFGNFDGIANETELGWYARYPGIMGTGNGFPWVYPTPATAGVTIRVDGLALYERTARVTVVAGAESILAAEPASVTLVYTLDRPSVPSADEHVVSIALPSDSPGYDSTLYLRLPSGVAWSEANVSDDGVVTRTSPRSWVVDPQEVFGPPPVVSAAWIETWAHDFIPPTAAVAGPTLVERLHSAVFSCVNSTDNVGLTNVTWSVRANGTVVHGYASTILWTPREIGTFDIGVRVRDAEGLWDEANLTLRVVDTVAPDRPTGLAASLMLSGGGAVVNLTWSPVAADDLKAYRVYRSSDDGATFTFLGWSNGTSPKFSDASASGGGTFHYRVSAVDRYGNEGSSSLFVEAIVPSPGGNPVPLDLGLLLGISAVVVGAVAVAAYVLLRRRKKPSPPTEPGREP